MNMSVYIEEFQNAPTTKIGTYIDGGMYSQVYDSDEGSGIAVKASKKRYESFTDAWILYALYCMNSDHRPWMPKVYSMVIDFTSTECHSAMESLERRKPGEIYRLEGYIPIVADSAADKFSIPYGFEIGMMILDFEDMFGVSGVDSTFYVDGHSENWLKRGDDVVFIDPFCLKRFMCSEITIRCIDTLNLNIYRMARHTPNVKVIGAPTYQSMDFLK